MHDLVDRAIVTGVDIWMPARIVRPILLLVLGLTLAAAGWQIVRLDRDLDVRSAADAATADALGPLPRGDARPARRRARLHRPRPGRPLLAQTAPPPIWRRWSPAPARSRRRRPPPPRRRPPRSRSPSCAPPSPRRAGSTAAWPTSPAPASATTPTICSTATRSTPASPSSASSAPSKPRSPASIPDPPPPSASSRRPPPSPPCGVALLVALILARLAASAAPTPSAPAHVSVVPARADAAEAEDCRPRFGERAASPAALQAAADVCGALARVQQPLELAGLVERMHGVLDSRGTIVWIFDETNDALRPGLSAGYASTAIGRMGTIPLSSDTPVATAFTRGEARSVRGTHRGAGRPRRPHRDRRRRGRGGDDRAAAGQRPAAGDAGPDADLRRAAGRPARGQPASGRCRWSGNRDGGGRRPARRPTGDTRERAASRFADLT